MLIPVSENDDLRPDWPLYLPILWRRSLTGCGWQWLPTWPASRAPPASTPNRTRLLPHLVRPSAAWTRWPPSGRTSSSTSGGRRRSAGSSPLRCPAGSRWRTGSIGPASSTEPWSTRPPSTCAVPRCPPSHPRWGSPTCSSRPCSPPPANRRTRATWTASLLQVERTPNVQFRMRAGLPARIPHPSLL